jgi:hypothetical protein
MPSGTATWTSPRWDREVEALLRRVEEDALELEDVGVSDLVDVARLQRAAADVAVDRDLVTGLQPRVGIRRSR